MLTLGSKLGPYEIQDLLGTGGMGEAYRGKDTRLFDCPFLYAAGVVLPYPYDVAGDGQRFIVNFSPRENAPPITLVINWTATK